MKHILICDDDPLLVDLLSFKLRSKGFEVEIAGDGEEALRKLNHIRPHAIVLDAMMPVVDGYEVLRRLRENEETAGIPVLMLTSRRKEEDIVSALEMGANEFMVKPFIPEELVARLSRLVGD